MGRDPNVLNPDNLAQSTKPTVSQARVMFLVTVPIVAPLIDPSEYACCVMLQPCDSKCMAFRKIRNSEIEAVQAMTGNQLQPGSFYCGMLPQPHE